MNFIKENISTIKNLLPEGSQEQIAESLATTAVTVSRVWNDHTHAFSDETQKRVLEETGKVFLEVAEKVNEIAKGVRKELRGTGSQS